MIRLLLAALAAITLGQTALAATAVNRDAEPRTIIVTEGGRQSELALAAGETVQFCPSGCFVTMPNGDREALTGTETLEISGGQGRIR
jgi:hypothetical protein